jgi:hypothetical protein
MDLPFTRLLAARAPERPLYGASEEGIQEHTEETYQYSREQEPSISREQRGGGGDHCRTGKSSRVTGGGDPAAGPGRHRLPGPQESWNCPTPSSHGRRPGVRRSGGQGGGHQPDSESRVRGTQQSEQRSRSSVGQHLPGVSPVAFGVDRCCQRSRVRSRDQVAGNEKSGQYCAAGPTCSIEDSGANCPGRQGAGRSKGGREPGNAGDTRADQDRQQE